MLNISSKQQINKLVSILMAETDYKKISELQKALRLSRRSVFYWLKQLNCILDEMRLDHVQHLARGGYFLTQNTKKALLRFQENDDFGQLGKDGRRVAIVWLLVQHVPRLSLINLSRRFHVSKNTMIKDLKIIRSGLPSPLSIENRSDGKVLTGDEEAQRKWIYTQIVRRNQTILGDLAQLPYVNPVMEALALLQQQSESYFSDDAVKTLIYYISCQIDRINRQGALLSDTQMPRTDVIAAWCRRLLGRFAKATDAEVAHLRKMLLTAQLQSTNSRSPIMNHLLSLSRQIVYRFYTISGIDISSESLIRSLATHLLPTYYRIKYRVPYYFPDLSVIMADYAHLMELTRYAVDPFERFIGEPLSADELGLITAYFGGELKKIPTPFREASKPDVYLVCTSGIGTTRLLSQQLSARYPYIVFSKPMNINEFHEFFKKRKPKLIITTATMTTQTNIPVIHVQAILSQYDFQLLDQEFRKIGLLNVQDKSVPGIVRDVLDIVFDYARIEDFSELTKSLTNYFASSGKPDRSESPSAHPSLSELIPEDNIQIAKKIRGWKAAVNQSFKPLIGNQKISNKYVRKIIELTESKGPYMLIMDQVMLAHATPQDGVNALAMSMLLLRDPTAITHEGTRKEVRVIFCLAPIDRISHVDALGQLLNLLNDSKRYRQLLEAESTRDIRLIFDQVSSQAGNDE